MKKKKKMKGSKLSLEVSLFQEEKLRKKLWFKEKPVYELAKKGKETCKEQRRR